MSSKHAALLLGAAGRVTVAIARSLHRCGVPVVVGALLAKERRLHSRAIQAFSRLPHYDDEPDAFMTSIAALARDQGADMVIPCSDSALIAVSRHYARLSQILHVACPPPHIVARVLDKSVTLAVANDCGIPIPVTAQVADERELNALRGTLRFPVIVKPRDKGDKARVPFRIRYCRSSEQLEAVFAAHAELFGHVLVQEYCVGEGVGIEVLLHRGEPVGLFQHRRLKELPVSGGVSVSAVSERLDPMLAEWAVTLLRRLEWEGVAMVEFRRNRADATAVLMEVNGRYWGSLPLAVMAGIDFPSYEWQLAHGGRVEPHNPAYEVGIHARWEAGDLLRVHSILTGSGHDGFIAPSRWRELLGFVIDFLPPTRSMQWAWGDPMPALLELGRTLKSLAGHQGRALFEKAVSPAMASRTRAYLRLNVREKLTYARLGVRRLLARRQQDRRDPAGRVESILFVCHGNIIRSPMAAAIAKRCLQEHGRTLAVASAGLYAKAGRSADPRAVCVAREFGIALDEHRAKPVTRQMVEDATIIFVMDHLNEAQLLARYPDEGRKVVVLGSYLKRISPQEIRDPYYDDDQESVRRCYEMLDACIRRALSSVLPSNQQRASLSEGAARRSSLATIR